MERNPEPAPGKVRRGIERKGKKKSCTFATTCEMGKEELATCWLKIRK